MELRRLRYFVAVAEEMSFRRAANRLFMEQPSLSRQIQKLEAEIGVLLFRRIRRHIELTRAGRVFLEEARLTLAQANHAVHAAQQAGRGEVTSLAVGFCVPKSSYTFDTAFPGFMQAFRRQRPDVRIALTELCSPATAKALDEGKIDVGFLQIPITNEALTSHCLKREPLALALPQSHPLAGLPEIPLSALDRENFLLFPKHLSPSLHQEVMAACARAGFQPHVLQEAASAQEALSMVSTGIGIAFVSTVPAGIPPAGVVYKGIENLPISLELSLAWRRDNVSAALDGFVGLAKEMF